MKTIKFKSAVVMMFVLSCLLVSTQLFAQEKQRKTPEERASMLTDKMKKDLNLTDDQYKSVYDINLKYAKQNEEAFKNAQSKDEKIKIIKASEEAKDQELKGVLTDDQYTKYQLMKDQMKENAKNKIKNKK